MARKILFLGDSSRFMMNVVVSNLERAGYKVISIQPNVDSINQYQNETDIVIVFLAPSMLERGTVLHRLKDLCDGKEKSLFLIGDTDELWSCRNIIPNSSITAVFEKPVDVKMLIYAVDHTAQSINAKVEKSILLVDDDGDYLKLINSWLSRIYHITLVSSGMQALTYLANNKPDLILLDYSMPVISGPQVLEMIRSEPETASIPVIFLTGQDDRESVMKGLELEPAGYILKSVSKNALRARLAKFFNEQIIEDDEDEEEEDDVEAVEDTDNAQETGDTVESGEAEPSESAKPSEYSEFSGLTKPSKEPKPPEPSKPYDPFDNLLSW